MLKVADILFVSLLFVSIPSTLGQKDFCQSFVGNNNSIDYGFQIEGTTDHYLVIGSEAWKVLFGFSSYLQNPVTSGLLNSRYGVAFGGAPCANCQSGVNVKKNSNRMDWALINIHTLNKSIPTNPGNDSVIIQGYNVMDNKVRIDFKYTVGYLEDNYLTLVQQNTVQNGSKTLFSRTHSMFEIKADGSVFRATKAVKEKPPGNERGFPYQLIAVFSNVYTQKHLFKDNQRIIYCYVKLDRAARLRGIIEECTPDGIEILIDCKGTKLNPLPTTGATTSNPNLISTTGSTASNLSSLSTTKSLSSKPSPSPTIGGTTPKPSPSPTIGGTTAKLSPLSTIGGTTPKLSPLSTTGATTPELDSMSTTGATAPELDSMSTSGDTAPELNSMSTSGDTAPELNPLPTIGEEAKNPNGETAQKKDPLSTSGDTTSGSFLWLIVLLVLAVIIIVLIISAVLYWRGRSAPKEDNNPNKDSKQPQSGVTSQGSGQDLKASQPASEKGVEDMPTEVERSQ